MNRYLNAKVKVKGSTVCYMVSQQSTLVYLAKENLTLQLLKPIRLKRRHRTTTVFVSAE